MDPQQQQQQQQRKVLVIAAAAAASATIMLTIAFFTPYWIVYTPNEQPAQGHLGLYVTCSHLREEGCYRDASCYGSLESRHDDENNGTCGTRILAAVFAGSAMIVSFVSAVMLIRLLQRVRRVGAQALLSAPNYTTMVWGLSGITSVLATCGAFAWLSFTLHFFWHTASDSQTSWSHSLFVVGIVCDWIAFTCFLTYRRRVQRLANAQVVIAVAGVTQGHVQAPTFGDAPPAYAPQAQPQQDYKVYGGASFA